MNIANIIRNADRNLATVSLILLTLLVFAQVVMRVVFLSPLVGVEEFIRYLLIWVVFIGMPYTTRLGDQIKMEELQTFMPKWFRFGLRICILISAVVTFAIVAVAAVITTLKNLQNTTATLSIPFWIFFLPTVLGFILVTFESVVRGLRLWRSSGDDPEESTGTDSNNGR